MSWKLVKIGDVCKTGAGGTPLKSKKELYEGGTIPWLLSGEVSQGEIFSSKKFITEKGLQNSSAKMFPANTVLVAMYGATAGQVGILRFEASTNQAICGIYPNDKLLPKFIYYSMLSKQKELIGKAAGNAQPNISQIKVKNTEIPLIDLEEQKRIVAILDEAFAGIDTAIANTEKNLANARELFDSTSQSIFLGGTDWEKKTLLELLELNWITSHLDGNHGGDYPRKSEFVEHGIPYISAKCIKDDSVDISLSKFLTPERASKLRKGIAQDRDVLFAHNATVGPVAMLYTDLEKIILGTSLTYYRCNTDHIFPEYLAHYMRSPVFKNQYELVMRQSTRNQVPITKQREFFHLIPPLDEQKEIADRLDGLRIEALRLESVYKQKLTSLEELKQSLLQKAFSGELTAEGDKLMDEAVA